LSAVLSRNGGNRPEEGGPAHASRAERAEVTDDLAGAHREADQSDVGQIEVLQQRDQVGREGVVVVAHRRLARAAEPATVIADAAIAGGEQLSLLALPRVAVERIAMNQHDRLAAAVVLVVDLDRGVVLGSNSYAGHGPIVLRERRDVHDV
jgi:hypothetical protein